MKKYRSTVGAAVFAGRLATGAALTLCLVQCSAEEHSEGDEKLGTVSQALVPPPTTPEYCGGRSCSGHNDCKINVPVCAVVNTAFCLTTAPNECVWKIDTTNLACRCIEHDIRLCTVPGTGAAGNQICTKTSSTSAEWSTCVPCPTCTPRP